MKKHQTGQYRHEQSQQFCSGTFLNKFTTTKETSNSEELIQNAEEMKQYGRIISKNIVYIALPYCLFA